MLFEKFCNHTYAPKAYRLPTTTISYHQNILRNSLSQIYNKFLLDLFIIAPNGANDEEDEQLGTYEGAERVQK